MTFAGSHWTRGSALYRMGREPAEPARWSGGEWERWPQLLGDLLEGDTTLNEIPETEARHRWPDAFAER